MSAVSASGKGRSKFMKKMPLYSEGLLTGYRQQAGRDRFGTFILSFCTIGL